MKNAIKIVLVLLLLAGYAVSPALAQKEKAAEEAARKWLVLMDEGKFKEAWEGASNAFKAQISVEQWEAAVPQAYKQSGVTPGTPPVSRELLGAQYAEELPGVPKGEYVVMQFNTSHASANVVETVTMQLDGEVWKAIGYFVKPA